MNLIKYFKILLNKTDLKITHNQILLLIQYVTLLYKWNKIYHFTSLQSLEEMIIKHIFDSIIIKKYLINKYFIDVGTGPGLPGIPLAIVKPDIHITLLDSSKKKVIFLQQIKYELKLKNIDILQIRVEYYKPLKKFDGVISRGFASLKKTLLLCHHLPKNNIGKFYLFKSKCLQYELSECFLTKPYQIFSCKIPKLKAQRYLLIL